ncbi:MAG: carbohydrate-binding family 9-like protein [Litorilinea sp.]
MNGFSHDSTVDHPLPQHTIEPRPGTWSPARFAEWDWAQLRPLPTLQRADGYGAVQFPTEVRVCADASALYTCFDCQDNHIWGTLTGRNAPIYTEEVVEIFIAPGTATPQIYYEFELSPNGTLLDLRIDSPNGNRQGIHVDSKWDCGQVEWAAQRDDDNNHWRGLLVLPWRSICEADEVPTAWRANFYRIERPANAEPEFSSWSPTLTNPPDFHRPARFGTLHFQPEMGDTSTA